VIDRIFIRGYKRLLNLITARFNLKSTIKHDYNTITINMNHNTPTQDKDKIRTALSAYRFGMLSNETAIRASGLDINAEEELAKINKEKGLNNDYYATTHS